MKLKEWMDKWQVPFHSSRGGYGFHSDKITPEAKYELEDLTDYKISGLFNGNIWVWPKREYTNKEEDE